MTTPATPAVTARIRWTETSLGEFAGRVGTLRWLAFQMRPPAYDAGAWRLTSCIPGSTGNCTYYDEQREAQVKAEQMLEEFVSSLGAARPGDDPELRAALRELRCVQAGWAFGVPEDGREQWLDLVLATMDRMEAGR